MPQLVPSHVAVPFAGTGHEVHELPQLCTLVFDTQLCPQACADVAQVQRLAVHVPPVGQSALSWQPASHTFVVGLQPNPGGQPPAAAQSDGRSLHVPRSQTWPEAQARPQPPQLFSSAAESMQPL